MRFGEDRPSSWIACADRTGYGLGGLKSLPDDSTCVSRLPYQAPDSACWRVAWWPIRPVSHHIPPTKSRSESSFEAYVPTTQSVPAAGQRWFPGGWPQDDPAEREAHIEDGSEKFVEFECPAHHDRASFVENSSDCSPGTKSPVPWSMFGVSCSAAGEERIEDADTERHQQTSWRLRGRARKSGRALRS